MADTHECRAATVHRGAPAARLTVQLSCQSWQLDVDARSALRVVAQVDAAAVLMDDVLGDVQAQAHAVLFGAGDGAGVCELFGAEAGAVVVNAQVDVRALCGKADGDAGAVSGRGLYGVSVEVDEDLCELHGVGLHV